MQDALAVTSFHAVPFDVAVLLLDIETVMDAEQTIAEIECLERIFAVTAQKI